MADNLQSLVNTAKPFLQFLPMFTGTNSEPATSTLDTIRTSICAAPYNWSWNRRSTTVDLTQGNQDYEVSLPDFGWVERASITDPTITDGSTNTWEFDGINNTEAMSVSNTESRPSQIFAQMTDSQSGMVTFRFSGVPDKDYVANITYQRKPNPIGYGVTPSYLTSVGSQVAGVATYLGSFNPVAYPVLSAVTVTGFPSNVNNGNFFVFACSATELLLLNSSASAETPTSPTQAQSFPNALYPIPPDMSDVYRSLFISEMMANAGDERSQVYRSRGIAALINKLAGLMATDKNPYTTAIKASMDALRVQLQAQQDISAAGQ